jgi:FixJ family two-component response regulator
VKQPPTAFIVDDRLAVLDSLESMLKTHGYATRCFTSAAEFIAEQDLNLVGCVLVDPLMNSGGGAVLKWLHESGSLLSIVLISGLVDSADFLPYASPATRVLQKPYEVSALLTMVADGLAGSLSRQAVRERSKLRG